MTRPIPTTATYSRRHLLGLTGASVAALAVSGCANSAVQAGASDPGATPSTGGDFPRTVQVEGGSVTIAQRPERILCGSERMDLDPVLACGVQPLMYFDHRSYGLELAPWTKQRLDASVNAVAVKNELSVEQILAQSGDVMVTQPFFVEKFRKDLSQVLPLVTSGSTIKRTGWSDQLRTIAQALGAEAAAAKQEQEVKAALAELAQQAASFTDLKVATIYGYSGSIGQEAGQSGTRFILDALGLRQPERLRKVEEFSVELSMEKIDFAADADVLLVSDWSSNPDDKTTDELFASSLFRRLPAVQKRRAVRLDAQTTVGAYMLTALSIVPVAQAFVTAIGQAAKGQGVDLD